MRPRRSRRPDSPSVRRLAASALAPLRCALALLAALLAPAERARAQGDIATEGALFLLLPIGGRAVGLGQAVVAGVDGSEAVWWNPAGLARQEKRELAIHHSQPFLETNEDVVTLVIPSSLLGVIAFSANILDFGTETQTDAQGNEIGTITTTSLVFAGSYATAVGARLNAGINYKVLQFRVSCSAGCPAGVGANATSSAIDFGVQYDLRGLAPLTVGAAVRNLGPSLQVNDNPQRDALPLRVQLGLRWRATPLERRTADTEIAIAGDVVDRLRTGTASWRTGIDATWKKRASLRAGYLFDRSEASGPAIGFGLRQGGLIVDIGRQFGGTAEATGADPTFITLRYLF
jgi:hypothetical protein